MSQAVARRYARAIFELGRDAGELRTVVEDLARFADLLATSAELRELDRHPSLSDADRTAIVGELAKRLGASATATRSVTMLAVRQRLAVLQDIVTNLSQLSDEHEGVLRVTVASAAPLSASYIARLTAKLAAETGKRVLLEASVDTSLIAGVVARIGDRVIDGSVRHRLDRLTQSFRNA